MPRPGSNGAAVRHRHGRAAAGTDRRAAQAANDAAGDPRGRGADPVGDRRVRRHPSVGCGTERRRSAFAWLSARVRPPCCGWCWRAGSVPAVMEWSRAPGIAGAEPDHLVIPVRNQPAGPTDLRCRRCSVDGSDDGRLSGAGKARRTSIPCPRFVTSNGYRGNGASAGAAPAGSGIRFEPWLRSRIAIVYQ